MALGMLPGSTRPLVLDLVSVWVQGTSRGPSGYLNSELTIHRCDSGSENKA